MDKHGEQPSAPVHRTEFGDLPHREKAAYLEHGHVRESFLGGFTVMSLEDEANEIESQRKKRFLTDDEHAKINSLRRRAAQLKSEMDTADLSRNDFIGIRVHLIGCKKCKAESVRLRGDLSADSLPLGK